MPQLVLLVDFGSTYTKIVVVDLDGEGIVGRSQAPSTVDTDMTLAYFDALKEIRAQLGRHAKDFKYKLCCSSAAGGLRVVCCGLVPSLTSKAARFAAYSAGAKVAGTYSYELTKSHVAEITEQLHPDIILLVGGTDGGDKNAIIRNSMLLAKTSLECPIILAGNIFAVDEAESTLRKFGKNVIATENVLPGLDKLNIAPAQAVIRKLFMNQIICGKGLGKARSLINPNVIPTPLAVFNAARLLANGTDAVEGIGELVAIDIGGCTTDVDSLCAEKRTESNVIRRGIPEPFAKRTVEGDLGIRDNAPTVVEIAGEERIREIASMFNPSVLDSANVKEAADFLHHNIGHVPKTREEMSLDELLASICLEISLSRHVGRLEKAYDPSGSEIYIQYGKDLRTVRNVIGTGGVFAHAEHCDVIFQGVKSNDRLNLTPEKPQFYIDNSYIFYAMGLLNEIFPDKALTLLKKSLTHLPG
jgi:uncharacterized protein (TIGR01319 family)